MKKRTTKKKKVKHKFIQMEWVTQSYLKRRKRKKKRKKFEEQILLEWFMQSYEEGEKKV